MNTIYEHDLYRRELLQIEKELRSLPKGNLLRRGTFYTHYYNGKEIGITRNKALIRQLCRKKYLIARQKQLNANLAIVLSFNNKYDPSTPDEIISRLPQSYSGFPNEYFFRQPINDWSTIPYNKNSYRKEDLIYPSNNGIYVRSKSEMIIANYLESYNIPYRYEAAIILGTQTKYPDFTIKKPMDGTIILWEHWGALHKPGYIGKMNQKLELYVEHGFVPFENLICTFELDLQNIRRIKDFIETIILRC